MVIYQKVILVSIILSFVTLLSLKGQISIGLNYGKIIPHTNSFTFEVPKSLIALRFDALVIKEKSKEWQNFWGNPMVTASIIGIDFRDKVGLGHAFGSTLNLEWKIFKRQNFSANISVGSGFAYLTKKYDPISNIDFNAIGSHLNNCTNLGVRLEYAQWFARLDLVHFSNGGSITPNRGLNLGTFGVGYSHKLFRNNVNHKLQEYAHNDTMIKWGIDLGYIHGFHQERIPNGPTYFIKTLSTSIFYRHSKFLKWHLGYDLEYNDARYSFLINDFSTPSAAKRDATHHSPTAGVEMIFGRIAIRPRVGYYLGGDDTQDPFYIRLEALYCPFLTSRIRPYVGVSMKSHKAVAEYIAAQVGINI